ncbi:MAG: DNA-directed RNA polymerase subunit A'' [Candidatus Aenigmarchaeota archaeon]|nr:DNA-directed RNA polymerase subunit A'' [Candidatus Aenigmarchaeota archaeon]
MIELPKSILEKAEKIFEEKKIPQNKRDEILENLKKAYKMYLYEPGEAIGIVSAQSISEPATQMSLDAGEKVIIKNMDRIKISEIGKFTDTVMNAFGFVSHDDWDICELGGMYVYVPSISQDEKIEWKRVLACSRHESPEKLLKIKTMSGREITATDSHSFVIRKDNSIVAISGKDLKAGERIPTIKLLPENCIHSVDLAAIAGKEFANAKKPLPRNFELGEIEGFMFGAYLSEGNSTQNFVSISNTDGNFLQKIRLFAAKYGLTYNEYDNFRGFAKGHDIHVNSVLLSSVLAKTCGKGSANKRVPDFAYSADENFVSGLLRAYFDGDGSVSVDRDAIRISSNSEELIDGIALLLNRFGIFSHKGRGKQSTLSILARYAVIFREKIGFVSGDKPTRLDELCSKYADQKQDFVELVGGFGDLLVKAAKKLGYPTRYVNSFTNRQKIGKSALLRYIVLFDQMAKEKKLNINEELGVMKRMYASDVVWDEIVEIIEVEPSSKFVYDLTVEGTETFTTFDGIVTHNTMRSYHVAGSAGIRVTLGLPRLMEIFDARRTPTTPMMIIYLEKQYQSKEKARDVAAKIKEVRIEEMVTDDVIDLLNSQLELKIDLKKASMFGLDKEKIIDGLKKNTKDIVIKSHEDKIIISTKKEEVSIREMQKLKVKILDMHLYGIKGIQQVVVKKEGDEWVLNTLGSNLKKVMAVEGVDATRIETNDIHEVAKTLGIEAARSIIIKEASRTLGEQGLEVDIRHIMLVADAMTATGKIQAIGRYGVAGSKGSVLARAAFEETIKHLTAASIRGRKDRFNGAIENVMVGKLVPIGTGMFDLAMKVEEEEKK